MSVQFDEDKQNKRVKDLRKQEEEELARILAEKYGISYIDLAFAPVNMEALRLIPEQTAREAKMVPLDIVDKKVTIGVLAPQKNETINALDVLRGRGYTISLTMLSEDSLERGWAQYKDLSFAQETKAGSLEISNEQISKILGEVQTKEDIKHLIEHVLSETKGYRISKILEIVLAGSIATGASDIHIEPEESSVRLRYRLDGVLNNIIIIDLDTYQLLLSRVKLLSGLKLNLKDEAQDGRFSVKLNDSDIEIRTSVLPGGYGESIVLRILNPKSISVPLEELGIDPKLLKILLHQIAKPNGLLLTTGPTGSGKTTTLYAFLKKIHTPDIKIITIEDPIEYHLPGVVQTQVEPEKNYTFLAGLRAALRQDPDVIMVGEIRDSETAEIAVNSALTGHLVLSTLHTNNAAGTFPRLIDLGVNSKIMSSAISVSMAQRLIRKLCPNCKKETRVEGETKTQIEKIVASIYDASYNTPVETMFLPVGCDKCNLIGYKGRIGIYEAILIDKSIEDVINSNPSEFEIEQAAIPQGILNMKQDGILKVLHGITSLEELTRVIDLEEKK